MSVPSVPRSGAGRTRSTALAAGLALALLIPLIFVFVQAWRSQSRDLEFAADERRGAEYLLPLTELVSVATEAQSATVRGQGVEKAEVERVVDEVNAVDRRLGSQLRSTERWSTVLAQLTALTSRPVGDREQAYTDYSELVDLTVALTRKIGDTSNLILDPEIDAYYLMNASLLRIPELIVNSGRYADLLFLASRTREDRAERIAQIAVARNQVAVSADDLAAGLEKSFSESESETLAAGIVRELDDFRTAVDVVAPTTSLLQTDALRLDPNSVSAALEAQGTLRRAALELNRATLIQLDLLIGDRISELETQRTLSVVALVLGVLLIGGAVVFLRPGQLAGVGRWASRGSGRHGQRPEPPAPPRELVGTGGRPGAQRGGVGAPR